MSKKGKVHKSTPTKKRSQSCYDIIVKKVTKWYEHLEKERKNIVVNPNTKQEPKRKELKPLSWYIGKIKSPTRGD
jgi:hypothetical protein